MLRAKQSSVHLLSRFIRSASTRVTTLGLPLSLRLRLNSEMSCPLLSLCKDRGPIGCSRTLSERHRPAVGQASGRRGRCRNGSRARVSFGDSVKMPVLVTVNGASVCPFQCSAWTAALWSAPPFSRPCAPWIATKLKSDSQRTVAARCQQGRSALGL